MNQLELQPSGPVENTNGIAGGDKGWHAVTWRRDRVQVIAVLEGYDEDSLQIVGYLPDDADTRDLGIGSVMHHGRTEAIAYWTEKLAHQEAVPS